MRCYMCDFVTEGEQSDHYKGIQRGGSRPRNVKYRPEIDKDVCSTCWDLSYLDETVALEDAKDGFDRLIDQEWDGADNIFEYARRIEHEDRYD